MNDLTDGNNLALPESNETSMPQFLSCILVAASTFALGTLTQQTADAGQTAANMVWVAHYFPDVAVDLFDSLHRPTVEIEDPVALHDLECARGYFRSNRLLTSGGVRGGLQ